MNKKMKTQIVNTYQPPKPQRKEEFLNTITYPKVSYQEFILTQFSYIRKRVWVMAILLIVVGWQLSVHCQRTLFDRQEKIGVTWAAFSLLPFLALLIVLELARSSYYRMEELEMSCRYQLSQVIVAKLMILGSGEFILLMILILLLQEALPFSLIQLAVYAFTPYLITCGVCLFILNRVRGQESITYCAMGTAFISMIDVIMSSTVKMFYSCELLKWWGMLLAISIVLVGTELVKLMKKAEELRWNYYLGS